MYILYAVAVFQGLLLSAALVRVRESSPENRVFALMFFLMSVDLVVQLLYASGFGRVIPYVLLWFISFPFLYPPLIFIAVTFVTGTRSKLTVKDLIHFLPFAIDVIQGALRFHFIPLLVKTITGKSIDRFGPAWLDLLFTSFLFLVFFAYTAGVIVHLYRYRTTVKGIVGEVERKRFRWILICALLFVFVWSVPLSMFIFSFVGIDIPDWTLGAAYAVTLYIFGFLSITRPEVLHSYHLQHSQSLDGEKNSLRYGDHLRRFKSFVEANRLYLDPGVTIAAICETLDIPVHQMSKALNSVERKNFYLMMNEYRVEFAKELLVREADKSILAIALESGFNSKSPFNDIFKKLTGCTPREYRQMNR